MDQIAAVFQSLWQLITNLWTLVVQLLALAMYWSLLIAWIAWWLWGVNWKRAWPVLTRGAWVPVVLLALVAALVWSRMSPFPLSTLGHWCR